MRVLDLFSCSGGAARGYQQAGFYVVGVDIENQPNYAGNEFYQAGALAVLEHFLAHGEWPFGGDFGMIHASPPCQHWSSSTRDATRHLDLVTPTRSLLEQTGLPYVIENVERAPLIGYLRLCGSMFGLDVRRHRYFELSFPAMSLACNHKAWVNGRPWTVTGNLYDKDQFHDHSFKPSFERGRELMEMPWVQTVHELTEAIPPAYTKFIGEQFLSQHVRGVGS